MYCKYCGKELREDAAYCPYCGRKQGARSLTDELGSVLFLIPAILFTAYLPFRLAGSGSFLTLLLTIPAFVIGIGCWVTYGAARRGRTGAAGLSVLSVGFTAQMIFFAAYGAALGVLAALSLRSFLSIEINISLLGIHTDIGEIFVEYFTRALVLLIVVCAVLAFLGVILCFLLNGLRRCIRFLKNKALRFPIRRTAVWAVVTAVFSLIGTFLSYWIYVLFYFLFYPGKTIADGILTAVMGDRMNENLSVILNGILDGYQSRSGQGNEEMDAVKDFFLASLSADWKGTLAWVFLLGALVCCVVLLVRIRKIVKQRQRKGDIYVGCIKPGYGRALPGREADRDPGSDPASQRNEISLPRNGGGDLGGDL